MAEKTFEELHEEFSRIAVRGDEAELKKFLVTNLKAFPKKQQEDIIMAFVEEAVAMRKDGLDALDAFQKEGLEAVAALEKTKQALEDRAKLLDIKEKI